MLHRRQFLITSAAAAALANLSWPGVARAGVATTWDTGNVDGNMTLSNGDLTVQTSASDQYKTQFATTSLSGKRYWEISIVDHGRAQTAVGVCTTSEPLSGSWLGSTFTSAGFFDTGHVYVHQSLIGRDWNAVSDPFGNGAILGLAYDAAAKLLWVTPDGTTWYGNPAGSDDPATGTGGIDCSPITGPLVPAVQLYAENDSATANFGASAFVYDLPDGFAALDEGYADGSDGAPATGMRLPNLLDGYSSPHLPPWKSPEVHYKVGYRNALTTVTSIDWDTMVGPGNWALDTNDHHLRIFADDCTIHDVDFGDYELQLLGIANTTVTDCKWTTGRNKNPISCSAQTSGVNVVRSCEWDGNAGNVGGHFDVRFNINGQGSWRFEYNYMHDAWGDFIYAGFGNGAGEITCRWNAFANPGRGISGPSSGPHPDVFQLDSSTPYNLVDLVFAFNTICWTLTDTGSQGFFAQQELNSCIINNNIFVAPLTDPGDGIHGISSLFNIDRTNCVVAPEITDNYIDPTYVSTVYNFRSDAGNFPSQTTLISGNKNLKTGGDLNS